MCRKNASHTLAYSLIALQEMNLAYKYPTIFWDCANLIVNSGGTEDTIDEDGTTGKDYNKIAQALGKAIDSGIKISPPDINKSDFSFTPDPDNNTILYGLSGINKIGFEVVQSIIRNRPYSSPLDLAGKISINRSQLVSLIKAGAFGEQQRRMIEYLWMTCDRKKRLTLQNMPGLIRYNIIPDREDLNDALRIYEFNRYLKNECKVPSDPENYYLDARATDFLNSIGYFPSLKLNIKEWDKAYKKEMDVFREWIAADKENILNQLNDAIFFEDWNRYGRGNVSAWEMEALCYYYHEHELAHIDNEKYGIVSYSLLPEIPIADKVFIKNGRHIPLFKITRIAGTVIGKNKNKHLIHLLTVDGVVTVKLNKGLFLEYDKQISVKDETTGKKTVVEKSWFTRGNILIVQGYRRGDEFVSKKYKSTSGHHLYKIDEVQGKELIIRSERKKGEAEDEPEEV